MHRKRRIVSLTVVGVVAIATLVAGSWHWSGAKISRSPDRYLGVPTGEKSEQLAATAAYWNDRLTYPTGRFNPKWVRDAAREDARIPSRVPGGQNGPHGNDWTSLGPKPERMTGCTGCFDYGFTEGRINSIVVDPTTTTQRLDRRLRGQRRRRRLEDDQLLQRLDDVDRDDRRSAARDDQHRHARARPHRPQHDLRGHGRPQLRLVLDGQPGHPQVHRTAARPGRCSAQDVFGMAYPEPAGQFPQYDAVGKVRVDPNSSSKVSPERREGSSSPTTAAPTGPGRARRRASRPSARTSPGSSSPTWAARRGSSPRSACAALRRPSSTTSARTARTASTPARCRRAAARPSRSIASNANGFVFGNGRDRQPVHDRRGDERRHRQQYVNPTEGNQLGRIDIGVAPSNPNVIYAQVQSIAPNTISGTAAARHGCQLGVWATTNGGTTWTFMAGSQGPSLGGCGFDYPQNWYDQGIAVDPNNPDRVFIDTFDIWFANRAPARRSRTSRAATRALPATSSTSTSTRSRS